MVEIKYSILIMEQFDIEKWRKQKEKQEKCGHDTLIATRGVMSNGRPITRVQCIICEKKFESIQTIVNDEDRIIPSKKHEGKTLKEIAKIDMPYLSWVALKSKMGQPDRYACARVWMNAPYVVPGDGETIPYVNRYEVATALASFFIQRNGDMS